MVPRNAKQNSCLVTTITASLTSRRKKSMYSGRRPMLHTCWKGWAGEEGARDTFVTPPQRPQVDITILQM